MTAEAIARVVADLRAKRVRVPDEWNSTAGNELLSLPMSPVIDATDIYRSIVDTPRDMFPYEDHPCIAPPWEHAVVSFVNGHGNVISIVTMTVPKGPDDQWQTDADTHVIDWDRVKWNVLALLFIGGRSPHLAGPIPTSGPLWGWRIAVYEDGSPADLRWVEVTPGDAHEWDIASLVLLGSLNFLNCSNVDVAIPARPRAETRRIARTGVEVHTISVYPPGKATRTTSTETALGAPLRSVRGHFAHYGPDYHRGLLFGKLAGRFWIPQRAVGETTNDYELRPR